jgi:hypothetical protein
MTMLQNQTSDTISNFQMTLHLVFQQPSQNEERELKAIGDMG